MPSEVLNDVFDVPEFFSYTDQVNDSGVGYNVDIDSEDNLNMTNEEGDKSICDSGVHDGTIDSEDNLSMTIKEGDESIRFVGDSGVHDGTDESFGEEPIDLVMEESDESSDDSEVKVRSKFSSASKKR